MEGDKGQGQTVEERKLGMTLQLETYTKFYLLEISLWSSSTRADDFPENFNSREREFPGNPRKIPGNSREF